jgi:molecular chaperone HscB
VRPYVIGDHGGAVLERWPADGEAMPDHFAVLGLPRLLTQDDAAVEQKVRGLIRQLHPDRYLRDGPIAVERAQRHTALVNDAWRVLRDFERRCQYLIELAGDRPDEAYKPTTAELALTLERNEQLDELQTQLATATQDTRRALRSLLGEIEGERVDERQQLQQAAALWDTANGEAAGESAARKRLRASLGRLAYLDNLRTRTKALLDRG